MKDLTKYLIISFCLICCTKAAPKKIIPSGWMPKGNHFENYQYYVAKDPNPAYNNCICIESDMGSKNDFCTLRQAISAKAYRNQKVRFTGHIKTNQTKGPAALWMSVYDSTGRVIGFDNMINGNSYRAILGTHNWKECEIVLFVPENAASIAFGCLLGYKGEAYFDKFNITKVDSAYSVTGFSADELANIPQPTKASIPSPLPSLNMQPMNLDLEEGGGK